MTIYTLIIQYHDSGSIRLVCTMTEPWHALAAARALSSVCYDVLLIFVGSSGGGPAEEFKTVEAFEEHVSKGMKS